MTSTTPSSTRHVWRAVAVREVSTQARSKTFLLSAGFLALGLVALVVVLSVVSGRETTRQVAVVDELGTAAVAQAAELARDLDDGLSLEATRSDSPDEAEQAVRDGEADVALVPTTAGGYELVGDDELSGTTAQALTAATTDLLTQRNADRQDVDLEALARGVQVDERLLDPGPDDAGLREAAALVFVVLFFVTAISFGMAMAATVTQEKESRVVEILAAAVPLRALLWGKVAGTSVLALAQTLLLVLIGVVALVVTGQGDALGVLGSAIAWYVVFFVLGFVTLASLWSVAGSLAGRQQDLQGTTAPLQVLLMAPYFVSIMAGESVQTVFSMLPVVSTMVMPARLAQGPVPGWQLALAVGLTLLAAVLLVRLSARVYERTLLQTDRRISFGEALRHAR
ncbi:MAG: ABC transporter permease [Nocardioides marinisabuli]|uniref:ABC transporter permease n=1 Tax=Nocardioides marinisabuli TaxID=419476 RepID=UPI00321A69FA